VPGVPLVASFPAALSEAQQAWLSSTLLRLRKVMFHGDDTTSATLLQKAR